MPKSHVTNIIFGTMALGYHGYGARVHDAATANAMLVSFKRFGHHQIDTCVQYGDGSCEQMLADLCAAERFGIATRIHPGNVHGHEPEKMKRVVKESLARRMATTPEELILDNTGATGGEKTDNGKAGHERSQT